MKQIKLSSDILKELNKRKVFKEDTYEDIIWGLLEKDMELSEETKKAIVKARKNIREGKVVSFEEAKKKLGF
ncbi:MAG: hypothetical protein PHD81_01680 [Candidatus Nanoarchaeia archaeon]|nr:hypothetical protein [Candidatus Nanoarchaeia archaeon]MDD5587799.1 hypothetical protein [Candidatus Nanoarchaeia archaeon]